MDRCNHQEDDLLICFKTADRFYAEQWETLSTPHSGSMAFAEQQADRIAINR